MVPNVFILTKQVPVKCLVNKKCKPFCLHSCHIFEAILILKGIIGSLE